MTSMSRVLTGRSSELSDPLGIGANKRRWWIIQQNAGLTTIRLEGVLAAPTVTGTPALLNTTTGQFIQYTTAAVLNSNAGWNVASSQQTRRNYNPRYSAIIRTGGDITSIRFWIGLFSANPMASSNPAIEAMAFRYDTGVDGTAFWRIFSNIGPGAVGVVTVTTVPVTIDTIYRFAIECAPGQGRATYYINDVSLFTETNISLPPGSQQLGHVEQCRTLDANAKVISISKVACDQNQSL